MRTLRYILCWYFWLLFVVTACILVIVEPRVLLNGGARTGPLHITIQIAMAVTMIAATFVFGKAWWVLWHEQLPARAWCIAASVASSIAPAILLTLYALGGRPAGFWQTVGFFMVPLTIGIGGILFGLTDAVEPLPPVMRPHLGHTILTSVLLLYFGVGFVSGAVWGGIGFVRHKHLPMSYFVGLALCGLLLCAAFLKLKQELRKRSERVAGE